LQNRASKHIYLAKHNRAKWHGWKPRYSRRHGRLKPRCHPYPLHYWHKRAYYGYHFAGNYADPYYAFSWSIGWW
jgi:hypothetical protein